MIRERRLPGGWNAASPNEASRYQRIAAANPPPQQPTPVVRRPPPHARYLAKGSRLRKDRPQAVERCRADLANLVRELPPKLAKAVLTDRHAESVHARDRLIARLIERGHMQIVIAETLGMGHEAVYYANRRAKGAPPPVYAEDALRLVCDELKITAPALAAMRDRGRSSLVCDLRGQAAIALRKYGLSWPEIARLFNRDNHSTFLTAAQRVTRNRLSLDDGARAR